MRRTIARAVCGGALTLAITIGSALPAAAAPSVALVPFAMDTSNQAGWWHPLDEWNGMPYVAYNAPGSAASNHTVWVARHDPNGTWYRGCLPAASGCATFADDVGHAQPTIAIDGDGYIHAFASMHDDNWQYYRSETPGAVTRMRNRSSEMPTTGHFTYPSATKTVNGDVYLFVRDRPAGHLYRWNNATNRWSLVSVFANQSGFTVYPDDVIADGQGDIHIVWEWASTTAPGRHNGSYLRYSPATNRFYTAAGAAVTTPVTMNTGGVIYQPMEPGESFNGTNANYDMGIRGAKLSVDPATSRPVAAYRYRPTAGGRMHIRLASWTGSSWTRETVYAGAYDTFAAVDITTYGTTTRVYYAKNQTIANNHAFASTRQPGGTWTETLLLPDVPVERLAVIRWGAVDHLYLAAPTVTDLFYGTFPW